MKFSIRHFQCKTPSLMVSESCWEKNQWSHSHNRKPRSIHQDFATMFNLPPVSLEIHLSLQGGGTSRQSWPAGRPGSRTKHRRPDRGELRGQQIGLSNYIQNALFIHSACTVCVIKRDDKRRIEFFFFFSSFWQHTGLRGN